MYNFPNQKMSLSAKMKRDPDTNKTWGEDCVEFLVANSGINSLMDEIDRIDRMVDGDINDSDYDYVLNPLNTDIARYKRFGAKLRNLNILSPVRDLYLGEFGKRFKNVQVMDSNPLEDNMYKEGLNKVLENYHTQSLINHLNDLGIETGQESQELPSKEETENEYKRNWDANRVITGQETLDYIRFDKDIEDKYQDVYEDFVKYGRAITYKGIFHDDIDFEHVPARELAVARGKSNFIEDRAWAVRRQVLQPYQILDKYRKELSQEIIDWLADEGTRSSTNTTSYVQLPTEYIRSTDDYKKYSILGDHDGVVLYHVVWRSWRKVGILTFKDLAGQIHEEEVDETYKLDKEHGDIEIEWEWQSQVWEGYDLNNQFQFSIRPLPYNRMELNNSSKQKIPYNGRITEGHNGSIKSIMKTGMDYQILYNVLGYQREKTINKNKDKVLMMPQSLIPKGKKGWTEDKFMYFMNANSFGVYDDTAPNASFAIQGMKVMDLGLGTYIRDISNEMEIIKNNWWESIGMNRQRYGDTNSSDGKAVTEQAIFRSAVISEELNRKFEKFQEKDYAGLLDLSKLAYINGKKGRYINSEQRKSLLNILPEDALHRLETDYNVFVKNSSKEAEKLQALNEYAFSYAQNKGKASILMEILDVTNFTKGKEVIAKMEELDRQREEQMAQQQNETLAQVEAEKRESEQLDRDVKIQEAEIGYDKVLDKALLELGRGEGNQDDGGTDNNNDTDRSEEIRMHNHQIAKDYADIALKNRDQRRKEKETAAKIKQLNKPVTSK